MDFARQRALMVDTQIRPHDVTDVAVHAAFARVPRETFAPADRGCFAYAETEIACGPGRFLWRARDLAKLVAALDVQAEERALVIGGGSGYPAAILAALGARVTLLETAAHAPGARAALSAAGAALNPGSVTVVEGDIVKGAPGATFEVILIAGAIETTPASIMNQLADGGRLGCVVRRGASGRAQIWRRSGEAVSAAELYDAAPPLLEEFAAPRAFIF